MERRTFEDSLKDAFKDAEATPSDKVWTNVELELEKEKAGAMRRTITFYQMLAAAAVTLALLSTGVAYFIVNNRDQRIEQLVAQSQLRQTQEGNETGSAAIATEQTKSAEPAGQVPASSALADKTRAESDKSVKKSSGQPTGSNGASSLAVAEGSGPGALPGKSVALTKEGPLNNNSDHQEYPLTNTSDDQEQSRIKVVQVRALPSFYTASVHPLSFESTADPVALMMSKLAEQEMLLASADDNSRKKEATQEKVWTALGLAAGGFSAVSHSTAPAQSRGLNYGFSSNSNVADKQSKASGVAYSLGLSFGAKVANRWVVQGGVNYLTQSSNYVANNVIASPDYAYLQAESINALGKLPALADAATDRLAPTVPYSVNNSLKYFTLPMQAGYLLVNRKFGVQLNAGISTDLFLENTITPEGGSLDKTTQSSGSDSPYRTVNFSGLMGTEFSYRIGQRYRIALNPALRYPFSSVYKSDVGIESAPLTFDVGLRFRYIFK
ncbi:outer membrane beta-barrel protein [Chryseolinea sp. T2]|uniref:outer membrane beta-barrel protein n=1 Tax=Chryseolinea sp. T2 TaxID=3129255 RepID=UPI0030773E7D